MKLRLLGVATVLALFLPLLAKAQAPAGAPAGSTGICNDGTYSNAPSKRGACAGHKGVKTWFSPSAASPSVSASPAPSAPAASPMTPVPKAPASPSPSASGTPATRSVPAQRAQAPGGGNGQVWVNTSTKVYHCQGDRSYGTTKAGQYMTEADATAKGARPAYGKTCSK